jgi:ABC-type multidrug transport system permease subunit
MTDSTTARAPASPLLALSATRIRLFFREPGSLFWTFGFPLLITVALGSAFRNQGPPRSQIAVVAGAGSAAAASTLGAERSLNVRVVDATEAARRLRAGEILLSVEVPAPGQPAVYRYDPSRPDALAARRLVDDTLQRGAGRRDPVATRDETAIARGARYVDWLVPGLLGMQLLNGAMWGAAFNIVNARQRKLLKRLAATPMRRGHYLLSYRVSGLLFVPLQVLVLFLFARLTFGVVIQGSMIATLAIALLASWSFAGLGLLCASRAQNSETANGLINLITLPMMVLSGVFFSSSRFPAVLQPAIRLLPLSAFNEALRHVVNDGASIFSQGYPIAVLAGWALVTSVAAVRLFRWT